MARTVFPALGLLAGIAIGWFWGMSSLPEPTPPEPRVATCATPAIEAEVRGLELELELLEAEQVEGW